MPLNASKRFLLLATNLAAEECDLTVVKSKVLTRLHEEEAKKAGYNLDKYLAAKKANEKLVPKSSTTTRERAVRECAAERRLFATWMVNLRTKQKAECEAAEQQVDEGVADIVQKTNDAMEHGAEVDEHMEKAASLALALGQELAAGQAARNKQSNALHATKASAIAVTDKLATERELAAAYATKGLEDLPARPTVPNLLLHWLPWVPRPHRRHLEAPQTRRRLLLSPAAVT